MRKTIIAGNWKMNGSLSANTSLLNALTQGKFADNVQMLVCVPYPYLAQAQSALAGSKVCLGAQDVSQHEKGAFTGEVSGAMLRELGCQFALVGHSERRSLFGESDHVVAEKFAAAQKAGLIPVLCVGETLDERERGITAEVVTRQINTVIEKCGIAAFANAVIAYEPVWAIGTGKTASPEQAQAVHVSIRQLIAAADKAIAATICILYGGSMKGSNAKELLSQPDIDGGLIGGASLVAEEFLSIAAAV